MKLVTIFDVVVGTILSTLGSWGAIKYSPTILDIFLVSREWTTFIIGIFPLLMFIVGLFFIKSGITSYKQEANKDG